MDGEGALEELGAVLLLIGSWVGIKVFVKEFPHFVGEIHQFEVFGVSEWRKIKLLVFDSIILFESFTSNESKRDFLQWFWHLIWSSISEIINATIRLILHHFHHLIKVSSPINFISVPPLQCSKESITGNLITIPIVSGSHQSLFLLDIGKSDQVVG